MGDTPSNRLLIAAGAAAADVAELPPDVRALIQAASEILVMTPSLPTEFHLWTDDIDGARREADERLNAILGDIDVITSDSQQTQGVVGNEVPMTAFEDAIRAFSPDHILIALRGADHAAWQERRLVDKVKRHFDIPVTVFEIDRLGRIPPTAADQTLGL